MGLSRRQLTERFPDIVAFAEMEEFIDEPVKYYSSGMQARLAFAVAVCVDPDILLLDEVLAVGDHLFRARCLDRLRTLHARGCTIIVVSHDAEIVRQLCDRGVWLEHGRVRMTGDIDDVLDAYQASML
jgi:ABC-type polysaccharide/polyol phosphate transport system ATPase subunit